MIGNRVSRRHFHRGVVVFFCIGTAVGCSKPDSPAGSAPSALPAGPQAAAAPQPSPASSAAAADHTVTIPAGKLTAGTPCGDHPRLPSEEPAGISIEMNEFSIDAYPYPNDPAKPPMTNVSQSEAKALCEARGRRLCTELEWERACKGPNNTKYEYASRFDPKRCPNGFGALEAAGSRAACKSEFGVYAMHGFVFEWTASAWGRGDEGNSVVLRGGHGDSPYAHMRCAAAKSSPPDAKANSIGFRCCGGPENAAKVELGSNEDVPALEPVEPLEAALSARIKRAILNGQLTDEPGFSYSFDKVWRWHPVKHEELFLARYVAKPEGEGAARTQAVVVLLCDKSAQLLSKLNGFVDTVGEPAPPDASAPTALTVSVSSESNSGEAKFSYRFGQVNVAQPEWVKATSSTPAGGSASAQTSAAPSAGAPVVSPPSASNLK